MEWRTGGKQRDPNFREKGSRTPLHFFRGYGPLGPLGLQRTFFLLRGLVLGFGIKEAETVFKAWWLLSPPSIPNGCGLKARNTKISCLKTTKTFPTCNPLPLESFVCPVPEVQLSLEGGEEEARKGDCLQPSRNSPE